MWLLFTRIGKYCIITPFAYQNRKRKVFAKSHEAANGVHKGMLLQMDSWINTFRCCTQKMPDHIDCITYHPVIFLTVSSFSDVKGIYGFVTHKLFSPVTSTQLQRWRFSFLNYGPTMCILKCEVDTGGDFPYITLPVKIDKFICKSCLLHFSDRFFLSNFAHMHTLSVTLIKL